jgi:hypothetical protein
MIAAEERGIVETALRRPVAGAAHLWACQAARLRPGRGGRERRQHGRGAIGVG